MDALPQAPLLDYTVERDGTRMVVQGPYLRPPLVNSVIPQSAAVRADLEQGDVITAIDGKPVFAFSQLKDAVESSNGRVLELTVWRDGEEMAFALKPKRRDEPLDEGGFRTEWRIGVASGYAIEPAREALDLTHVAGRRGLVEHGDPALSRQLHELNRLKRLERHQ